METFSSMIQADFAAACRTIGIIFSSEAFLSANVEYNVKQEKNIIFIATLKARSVKSSHSGGAEIILYP
jgi:hypothetical protein